MADFQLESTRGEDYDNRVTVSIRFKYVPNFEDYQEIVDAMNVLDKHARKYISLTTRPVIKEKK